MACKSNFAHEFWNLMKFCELCSDVNKFRNMDDFQITKEKLYSPLCTAHDERKQQDVSIVLHKNHDLKYLLSEINFVSELNHRSVLKFYESSISFLEKEIGFIYESHACLLSEALAEDVQIVYRPEVIQHIMKDLFSALNYLHNIGVVHRDIRPANIVITNSCWVKVWNFWCAQACGEPLMELNTTDFRYQPVESILREGTTHPSLDIWSANIIFGELLLRTSIFPVANKHYMLTSIFALLGFPTKRIWKDFFCFRDAKKLRYYRVYKLNMLGVTFKQNLNIIISPAARNLLKKCFHYNPKKRPTAKKCFDHPYFYEEPQGHGSLRAFSFLEMIGDFTKVRCARRLMEKQIDCLKAIALM